MIKMMVSTVNMMKMKKRGDQASELHAVEIRPFLSPPMGVCIVVEITIMGNSDENHHRNC